MYLKEHINDTRSRERQFWRRSIVSCDLMVVSNFRNGSTDG